MTRRAHLVLLPCAALVVAGCFESYEIRYDLSADSPAEQAAEPPGEPSPEQPPAVPSGVQPPAAPSVQPSDDAFVASPAERPAEQALPSPAPEPAIAPQPMPSRSAAAPSDPSPPISPGPQQPSIDLSAGVALPQSLPVGTVMSFSVDYEFTRGQPNPSSPYAWVIIPAKGRPVRQPVPLKPRGTLQGFVQGLRPEHGPFQTHIEDVSGNRLSQTVPLR